MELAKLGKKYTAHEWIMDKFYRKFGNEELWKMLNNGEARAFYWWNDNIHHNKEGCISEADFQEFIFLLEKKKPKRFDYDEFGAALIRCMGIFGPTTYEMIEEQRQRSESIALSQMSSASESNS